MHLTVMTYNVRCGTFNPLGLEAVARMIERYRPDIVGLQEVNVDRYVTGPVDQPRWLGRRLGMESVFGPSMEYPEKNIPSGIGYYGIALLSRFPIRASEVHRLPRPVATAEQRTVLGASLETESGLLNVFVTHWGLDAAERAAQAEATLAFIKTWRTGPPVVLVGDFNAFPASPEITTLRGALADAWELAAAPENLRVTFPSGPVGSTTPNGWAGAIDYVFVGSGLVIESIEVIHDEERV